MCLGERPEPTGAGPGGGPGEERGEAPHRQPEARQGDTNCLPRAKGRRLLITSAL